MQTPHLVRVGYVSALCDDPSRAELEALLSGWRRCNAEHGITGILLYDAGSVFQVIEGFPEDVARLWAAIVDRTGDVPVPSGRGKPGHSPLRASRRAALHFGARCSSEFLSRDLPDHPLLRGSRIRVRDPGKRLRER